VDENIWVSGPIELLKHGINHIEEGKDFDLRIAMISIDNAVELAIKNFLALNRRVFGLRRKEYNMVISKFPTLVDSLENYVPDKISIENLDIIEQFHKVRNNLYHQGIGITVQLNIVERYALLAKDLISRLFNVSMEDLFQEKVQELQLYGNFLREYAKLEKALRFIALDNNLISKNQKYPIKSLNLLLRNNSLIDNKKYDDLETINSLRNALVHGHLDLNDVKFESAIKIIENLNKNLMHKIF